VLPAAYLEVPSVRANLVQGPAGITKDSNGSSRGISNATDLARLLELRQLADVVLTDGQTARLEAYKVPKSCDLAVFTKTGFTPASNTSSHKYLELRMSPVDAVRELLRLGYKRILLECGPGSLRQIIDADLLDQLCLTNTGGSEASLESLGIASAVELFSQTLDDTAFGIWAQIQGF
jgi:riboflavin biosynthesis pyrimidine reductase